MAQRLLRPQTIRPFQDAEDYTIIRDSEPLLISVLNEQKQLVTVDNSTREVCYDDFKQAITSVADISDISDVISIIDDQEIEGTHETIGDNDNGESELADIIDELANEDHRNVYQQLLASCTNCSKHKRVHKYDQLKRGDSIRFPRMGDSYYHHAIVKEVKKGSNSRCCTLKFFHLKKTGLPILTRVIEDTETYDLRKVNIERVIYVSNPFSPDEIIQRAEKFIAENKTPRLYNLLGDNCEHQSNLIAQGVSVSHQVPAKLKSGFHWILNTLFVIASRIMRLPGIATLVSIESLTKIIRKIKRVKKLFRDKSVCIGCYDKEYKLLKIALVLTLISLAVSVVSHFNWATLTLNLIIITARPFVVKSVYKRIMPLILPAFLIPKQILSIKNIPKTGDIITFDYHNLAHDGVVAAVHAIRSDMKRLKATIIHYPWPGWFKTYTVTEEIIYFNQTDDVSVLDFEGTHSLPASDVVKRAKKQLGKQNHNLFTHSSSHLSRYCKTGSKSLRTLPIVPVRSTKDLSPGDVIRFTYCGLPHEAVLVKIEEAEDISINVIHYKYAGMFGTREVVNEKMTFNLPDKNMYIHDYENFEVYEPEEVVQRAESRVGEKKFNTVTNRSSHVARWCKLK